jgi:iron complex outermembrane receptor protein
VENYQAQRYGLNSAGILAAVPESIPSVVTKGVEFSVYGQPLENLMLNAGFIYNEARYPTGWTGYNPNDLRDPVLTDPNSTIGRTNLSEEQIVGVPETKFNFSADYSFSLGGLRAFLGADTVYKSDLRLGPTADERFIFPAGWSTGARLGIRSEDHTWSVTAFGRNITDHNEPVTLFGGPSFTPPVGNPGSDPSQPNGYVNGVSGWITPASLRQVGLTVEVRF